MMYIAIGRRRKFLGLYDSMDEAKAKHPSDTPWTNGLGHFQGYFPTPFVDNNLQENDKGFVCIWEVQFEDMGKQP
jgi:hypothetical protein